ncbi:MAG: hypothetical protein AAF517_19445, partial [Planctomycetota bacterium]
HTIANRSGSSTAVTIHVYGREMTKASIFQPKGEGWVTFHFDDGSTAKGPLGLPKWDATAGYGAETAYTLHYNEPGNVTRSPARQGRIWLQRTPIPESKRLVAITLPDVSHAKILGITLGNRDGVASAIRRLPPPPRPADIAIFHEERFAPYKSAFDITAQQLSTALELAGVSVSLIGLDHLAKPSSFDAKKFPVLVNLYGKAFPADAIENLRAYRQNGGRMVHTSVPFTHSTTRSLYGEWSDRSTSAHAGYESETSLGVNVSSNVGFEDRLAADPAAKQLGLDGLPWGKLRFDHDYLQGKLATPQGLDRAAVGEAADVVPILSFVDKEISYAALVKHKTAPYEGCVDLWFGTAPLLVDGRPLSPEAQASLLARASLFALSYDRDDDSLTKKLADISSALTEKDLARAPLEVVRLSTEAAAQKVEWKQKIPELRVVDAASLSPSERLLAASLQGLLVKNEKTPIFIKSSAADQKVLDSLTADGLVGEAKPIDLKGALTLLGHRRCVVVDPKLYGTINLATMIASLENVLIAHPENVTPLKLEVTLKFDDVFSNGAEIAEFVHENLRPRMPNAPIYFAAPNVDSYPTRDFMISRGLFTIWVPNWRSPSVTDASKASAAPKSWLDLTRRALESSPVLEPVLGNFGNNSSLGVGQLGVRLISQHARTLTRFNRNPNLSVLSTLVKQPVDVELDPPRDLSLDRNKIYITILDSELDSLPQTATVSPDTADMGEKIKNAPRGRLLRPEYANLLPLPTVRLVNQLKKQDCLGLTTPAAQLQGFGDAYGPEQAAKLKQEYLSRVFTQGSGAKFLFTRNVNLVTEQYKEFHQSLPKGTPIFVRRSNGPYSDPANAHGLAGSTPVFYDCGIDDLISAVNAAEGTVPTPLFLYFAESALSKVKGKIDFDANRRIEFVRPDEMGALYLELRKTRKPQMSRLLTAGSKWRYSDEGKDYGKAWRLPQFSDEKWKEATGPFGYGDSHIVTELSFGDDSKKKHLCYYFRKSIEIEKVADLPSILLEYIC